MTKTFSFFLHSRRIKKARATRYFVTVCILSHANDDFSFSMRYPPYEEKRLGWLRWLVEVKEQSYDKISDIPPLLLSIPVNIIQKVGIPV